MSGSATPELPTHEVKPWRILRRLLWLAITVWSPAPRADELAAGLPEGVKAVWDGSKALRETSITRERVCLNGLWRWQPSLAKSDQPPTASWGYFKVPGCMQSSPMLEYCEGRGMVLFPQLDVTARGEPDHAAEAVVRIMFRHVAEWKPETHHPVVYAGESPGKTFLDSLGLTVRTDLSGGVAKDEVLVLGPGVGSASAEEITAIRNFIQSGGRVLAMGLDQEDAAKVLPGKLRLSKAEHISTFFAPASIGSPFAGISPADPHNRDPRELPLVASGAAVLGNGILAKLDGTRVVLMQMAPWKFEGVGLANLRRTHRRVATACNRLLANLGADGSTPLLERMARLVDAAKHEHRWLEGFYLDQPEEWDDPYRFFRW